VALSTLRHAAKVGYCGLDRQRRPISGDEIRACWESRPETAEVPADASIPVFVRTPVPRRDFIEVTEAGRVGSDRRAPHGSEPAIEADVATPVVAPRWSLWEDAEA
jgi:hypothetical protein